MIIPDLFVEADPTKEKFKISLQQFMVPYNWYQVNEGSNRFTATDLTTNTTTLRTIPPGSYNYFELGKLIGLLYESCRATYLPYQNKIVLETSQNHRWVFSDGLAQIMGFLPEVPYEGTAVTSPYVCRPLTTEAIHVHITNLPCMDEAVNLTNVTGNIAPDTTLAIVPVTTTQPFHVLTYTNQLDDAGVYTSDFKLTYMDFLLTNEDGTELTWMPDHIMTLKIDTVELNENADMLDVMRKMQQDINDLLLSNMLR